jgi:two-component sensor histidine kinase
MLAELGTFALQSDELQPVLNEAARLSVQGTGTRFGKICEYRPEQGELAVRAGFGWREGVVGRALSKADVSTPVGRAFITGKPVITRNLAGNHDFTLPPIYPQHGIISSVNVVVARFGVLEVDSDEPRSFCGRDVIFLTGLANVCAEAAARIEQGRQMQRALAEQRTLLGELEHRVRNHLHMIVAQAHGLAGRTADPEAKRGFGAITHRVLALATLYDRLLGVGMTKRLDLGDYLTALCDNIRAVEEIAARGIEIICRAVPIEVALETATALGIIANELIANSLEHAFDDRPGQILVELQRESAGLRLIIADNGAGMSMGANGTGLNLVFRMARQLGGRLELCAAQGTRWELELPLPPTAE